MHTFNGEILASMYWLLKIERYEKVAHTKVVAHYFASIIYNQFVTAI